MTATTAWLEVRVGWILDARPCSRAGDHEQRCSGDARYRVISRGPLATFSGYLCANHLARNAAALGVDAANVGPWSDG